MTTGEVVTLCVGGGVNTASRATAIASPWRLPPWAKSSRHPISLLNIMHIRLAAGKGLVRENRDGFQGGEDKLDRYFRDDRVSVAPQ